MNWAEWIGETLTLLIMLFSLVGMIIPVFPGTLIIWIMGLIYGLVTGFNTTGIIVMVVLTVLAAISALADNVLMGAKARESGASWRSIFLALGAGVVFTFVFPPIGGLIAAPVVLYLAERNRLGDGDRAMKTVRALLIGWSWAFAVRFGLGFVMVVSWGIWALSS